MSGFGGLGNLSAGLSKLGVSDSQMKQAEGLLNKAGVSGNTPAAGGQETAPAPVPAPEAKVATTPATSAAESAPAPATAAAVESAPSPATTVTPGPETPAVPVAGEAVAAKPQGAVPVAGEAGATKPQGAKLPVSDDQIKAAAKAAGLSDGAVATGLSALHKLPAELPVDAATINMVASKVGVSGAALNQGLSALGFKTKQAPASSSPPVPEAKVESAVAEARQETAGAPPAPASQEASEAPKPAASKDMSAQLQGALGKMGGFFK